MALWGNDGTCQPGGLADLHQADGPGGVPGDPRDRQEPRPQEPVRGERAGASASYSTDLKPTGAGSPRNSGTEGETIDAARRIHAGRRYRHRPDGPARLCAGRRRGWASPIWWRPTMCSAAIPVTITAGGASAPRPPPITIPSCCSASSPACTQKVGFAAGVLILAQRQAALVAKQAASPRCVVRGSLPPRHRRRLERGRVPVGLGRISTTAASAPRSRCASCRRCGPSRTSTSPASSTSSTMAASTRGRQSGRVPIWFGGHAEATFRRAAKYGDGFMPLAYPAGRRGAGGLRQAARPDPRGGPRPASVGLEVWVSPGIGGAGRLAARDRLLEEGRRHPRHGAHHLCERPSQAHRRQELRRSPRRDHPLSARRWRICCRV